MSLDNKNVLFKKLEGHLILAGARSLRKGFTLELCEYLSLSPDQVESLLTRSEELVAEAWKKSRVDVSSEKSLIEFYNNTESEVFELMNWHTLPQPDDNGVTQYMVALAIAEEHSPGKNYLDYGCGVGTGAILFAKNGFDVTLGDVADPLLNFSRWRFGKRGLSGDFIDLKSARPKQNFYDVVTCFNVLEHVKDPLATLTALRDLVKEDGLIIFDAEFGKCDRHPMHIVDDWKLARKFRSVGLDYVSDLSDQLRGLAGNDVLVMRRASRNLARRAFCLLVDYYWPPLANRTVIPLKQGLLKFFSK